MRNIKIKFLLFKDTLKNTFSFKRLKIISLSRLLKSILIFIVLFLINSACNRTNPWENEYTIPDVTLTSASSGTNSITFSWIDPIITEMNAIHITCTEVASSIVVHTYNAGEGVENYTVTGLAASLEYNINIRITDNYGKSSPGVSFRIATNSVTAHFIYNVDDLNAVRGGVYAGWELSHTYNLMADLDLTGYDYFVDGMGWMPIGTGATPFTGLFDGNGHTISNMTIDRSATSYVGLFGYVNGGTVRNLNLVNSSITGASYVGGLIGHYNNGGPITGSSISGTIIGISNYIGGLLGAIDNGSVTSSNATANVTGGGMYIGGFIGRNFGATIDNCYAICSVAATGPGATCMYIGGLIGGISGGGISLSYTKGTVNTIELNVNSVGGLVGNSAYQATINNSYSEVNVTGTGSRTGGLIGYFVNYDTATVTLENCYATGTVSGSSDTGGLVGSCYNNVAGTIIIQNNCYATGSVYGSSNTGGLIGRNANNTTGTITLHNNCYATGAVSGSNANTGGLVGQNFANTGDIVLEYCYHTTGSVEGDQYVGGLVGDNSNTTIASCSSSGNVKGNSYVGGLVGRNESAGKDIAYSSTSCVVTGTGLLDVGGLVGGSYSGNIKGSHATGNVIVDAKSSLTAEIYIGGLAGYYTSGEINGSWTTGNINVLISNTGTDTVTGRIGGLIGRAGGTIQKSYATGNINISIVGTGTKRVHAGGLIGYNDGATITLCYHRTGEIDASTGTATYTYAGGLVGVNSSGSIAESYTEGVVMANTSSNLGTGGLVGLNTTPINNCYSICDVEAAGTNTGGFVGNNTSVTITNSYSAGSVGGTSAYIGGFCGIDNAGTYTSCYYDSLESGQSDTGKGEPRTTAQMRTSATFTGWGFTSIWNIYELSGENINSRYPYLSNNLP